MRSRLIDDAKGSGRFVRIFSECLPIGAVLFTLTIFPALMHDHYFDINRFKVQSLLICFSILFPLWAGTKLWLLIGKDATANRIKLNQPILSGVVFLIVCFLSAAKSGWSSAVLWGTEGRYSGLYFLLACGMVFLMSAAFVFRKYGQWLEVVRFSTLALALLGILNILGRDPFGRSVWILYRNPKRTGRLFRINHRKYGFLWGMACDALRILYASEERQCAAEETFNDKKHALGRYPSHGSSRLQK